MEGEPDLPPPPAEAKFFKPNQSRPISINPDSIHLSRSFNTTCTSTTSSSSSSPPDLVRHMQAAFKRHRTHGIVYIYTLYISLKRPVYKLEILNYVPCSVIMKSNHALEDSCFEFLSNIKFWK